MCVTTNKSTSNYSASINQICYFWNEKRVDSVKLGFFAFSSPCDRIQHFSGNIIGGEADPEEPGAGLDHNN